MISAAVHALQVRTFSKLAQVRPRRSVLYVPGSNARALDKACTLDADSLILDLEDAVAPSAKDKARSQVAAVLAARPFGDREVTVRINSLSTPWGAEDLAAVLPGRPHGIVLPKVESAAHVVELSKRMSALGVGQECGIWCMIETPLGVLRAHDIGQACPQVGCLVMGTTDLTTALRARHTPDRHALLASLSHCVLAARACGVGVLDGVQLDVEDDAAFARACHQALEMGFDGKTLIHPKTIARTNRVFAPSEEDAAVAREVVQAFSAAQARGEGVAVVRGKLVEHMHVAQAEQLLLMYEAIQQRLRS